MEKSLERGKFALELEEHLEAHERGFKVQLVGLALILLIVVAAALGLFGDGVLSKRTVSSGAASIEYQRFYRYEARMDLKIDLLDEAQSRHMISFPIEYLKYLQIESTTPVALKSEIRNNSIEYIFDGNGTGIVYFYFVPRKVGTISGEVSVNGDRFQLSHFIYP